MEIQVTLEIRTCSCGGVYAIPKWVTNHRCPMCAGRMIETGSELVRKLGDDLLARDRRIRALRGVIARKRKAVR